MYASLFTDELGLDITEGLPLLRSWGLTHVDLRGRVFGKAAENLPPDQLPGLRKLLADHGMTVACLESSLAKAHLPDAARVEAEQRKLDGILRAADALDCRRVRSFFFWQPAKEQAGALAVRPDELQKVLDRFGPLAERARAAGLILAFENCGVTPDEVFTVLDALGIPEWGMAWDPHNDWDSDERKRDEDAYIRRMAARTRLVHVKARGAVASLGPLIPYDKIVRACDAAGVTGPLSGETHNPDRTVSSIEMSRQVVETIQAAVRAASAPAAPRPRRAWEDDPVGFVVVGLGMGHNRSRQITKTPGTRLIGVSDLRPERARRTGEACGVPHTTDFREWLDNKDVEVVYVVTETGNHAEVALQALEAGKHVLTTKPMEASLDACDRMIRLAEQKGVLLGTDFDRRFVPEVHTLRAAVRGGHFGRLLSGNCSLKVLRTMDYFRENGGWRGTRRWDGGGILSNQAIHALDEIAFTVGIPSQVRCSLWTQNHAIEAEDLGTATWLYDDGLVITYGATTSYPHATWYHHYELEGTEGAYFYATGGPFEKPRTRWFQNGSWGDSAPVAPALEWINATDNFAAAVRGQAEYLCPGRDARRSQAILDALYRSAYENGGGWVSVQPELI